MLGAILVPESDRTRQIGQAPKRSLCRSMYWQINATGARTPLPQRRGRFVGRLLAPD